VARLRLALLAPLTLLLAACGGGDYTGGLPAVTDSSTSPSSTASSTNPSTTPAVLPVRSAQKYAALTLVLDHTAPPPAGAGPALTAYQDFERSAHRSEATNVEDPNLAKAASGQAVQFVRGIVKGQQAKAERTGGTITVKVKLARSSAELAAFTGCYDQSKSLLVRANGTSYVGPLAKKYPRLRLTVIVTNIVGSWQVTDYDLKADRC
jgi:hypothetical protein